VGPAFRLALAGLLAVPLVAGTLGCEGTTTAGSAYTMKISRELQTELPTDHLTAHALAIEALEQDLMFTVDSEAVDGREGIIYATTAREREVRVETFRVTSSVTRLEVYVTPMGNRAAASDVIDAITRRISRTGASTGGAATGESTDANK
jgi:hypothetical protein